MPSPPRICNKRLATSQQCPSGPWPAKSPDMNPIENLWAQMETSLQNRQHKPRNRDELWQTVQQIWNNINLFDADAATPRFKQQDITPVTDFFWLLIKKNKGKHHCVSFFVRLIFTA